MKECQLTSVKNKDDRVHDVQSSPSNLEEGPKCIDFLALTSIQTARYASGGFYKLRYLVTESQPGTWEGVDLAGIFRRSPPPFESHDFHPTIFRDFINSHEPQFSLSPFSRTISGNNMANVTEASMSSLAQCYGPAVCLHFRLRQFCF